MKKTGILLGLLIFCTVLLFCFCACNDEDEIPEKTEESHTFATVWTSDDTYHWFACTDAACDVVSGKDTHDWDAGTVATPATESEDGEMTYTCTMCGRTKTGVLKYDGPIHTVTAAQWESTFGGGNFTLMIYVEGEWYESVAVDGDIRYRYDDTQGEIFAKSGVRYYEYSYETQSWSKVSIAEETYAGSDRYPAMMQDLGGDFSLFTYDEKTCAYTAAELNKTGEDPRVLRNVTVHFENGCLVGMTYECETEQNTGEGTTFPPVAEFSFTEIGTTVINVPDIRSAEETVWENAFDEVTSFTLTATGEEIDATAKMDGDIIWASYDGYHIYVSKEGEDYYAYVQMGLWFRAPISEEEYAKTGKVAELRNSLKDDFDSFTYDEESGEYFAAELDKTEEGYGIFRNVRVKMGDGNLAYISMDVESEYDGQPVEAFVTVNEIGTTELTLPTGYLNTGNLPIGS